MPNEILLLITIVMWGVGGLFHKGATSNLHPFMVSIVNTSVYISFIPFYFLFFNFDHSLNLVGVACSISSAICMLTGTLAYFFAIKNSGSVGQMSVLVGLYPNLTLLLSCLIFGETLTIKKIFGIFFAIVSFLLISSKQ